MIRHLFACLFCCCPRVREVRQDDENTQLINLQNRRLRITGADYHHFRNDGEGIVVDKLLHDASDVNNNGLFTPLNDRQVDRAGTVTSQFAGKRREDEVSIAVDNPQQEDNTAQIVAREEYDVWFLKWVHISSIATEIKRLIQGLVFWVLSFVHIGEMSQYYRQKALYFYRTITEFYREHFGSKLFKLLVSKLPSDPSSETVSAENFYRTAVYCELSEEDGQFFAHPVLASKKISDAVDVNVSELRRELYLNSISDESVRMRDYFKASGDPALLYFLRILTGDEDCLKPNNFMIRRVEGEKPEFVAIDFGMIMYRRMRDIFSANTIEQALAKCMVKSYKHGIQYAFQDNMIELLRFMEEYDRGYLLVKFRQALNLIHQCTEQELLDCTAGIPNQDPERECERIQTLLRELHQFASRLLLPQHSIIHV